MRRFLFIVCLLLSLGTRAQIVNRLRVDQPTFLRYAQARMQEYDPANLELADSLYQVGVRYGNLRYKCLALSLEMPVRYAMGDYGRLDVIAAELKGLLANRKDLREFYFVTLNEYIEYLLGSNRMSEAVLEARELSRLAMKEKNPLGQMFSYRLIGLIHSYRGNDRLAVDNLQQALHFCRESRNEQELPNLYLLLAQEQMKMGAFEAAHQSCNEAARYQDFFPAMREKVLMNRALLYYEEGDLESFWACYDELKETPASLDVVYLRSRGLLEKALERADALDSRQERLEQRHVLLADMGAYEQAYGNLLQLMAEKDSVYLKVQDEDVAILEAEMDNARLREEAELQKNRNQFFLLGGFLLMFFLAFLSVLIHQWRVRDNLDKMRAQQNSILMARRAYRQALETKEAENAVKIKLIQNKTYNKL